MLDYVTRKCPLQSLLLGHGAENSRDGRSIKAIREYKNRLAQKVETRFEASVADAFLNQACMVHELSKLANVVLMTSHALHQKLMVLEPEGLRWPLDCQLSFLQKSCEQYVQKQEWPMLVRTTTPWGADDFDALKPALASLAMPSKQRCDFTKRVVFIELLASMIFLGESKIDSVTSVVSEVLCQYEEHDVLELDMVSCVFHQDVLATSRYLRCLAVFLVVVSRTERSAID